MSIRVAADNASGNEVFQLDRGSPLFTFGRDKSCTLCLDPFDVGISRIAGSISCDRGSWSVRNLSMTRPIHVIDDTGLAVPLPVQRDAWPESRRTLDCPELTVLVVGGTLRHAIRISTPTDELPPVSTRPVPVGETLTSDAYLTPNEREAVVAMVIGYLLPFPAYNPEPLTYEEAAQLIGLPRPTVVKRIERFRIRLIKAGIPGLEGEDDARRSLAEWVLSTRLVTSADLAEHRRRAVRRRTSGE